MRSLNRARWMRVPRLAGMFAAVVAAALMSQTLFAVLQNPPASERDRAAALDLVLAKDEISQQIYNYSRSHDRFDRDLALQMMHPDGKWAGMTREEWVAAAWKNNGAFAAQSFQMTNSTIKVTGDTAVSETYGFAPVRRPTKEGDKTMITEIFVTRYLDRWSKRNGRWALDERRLLVDMHMNVVEDLNPSQAIQQRSDGRRDRMDPVYELFR
jgi:hypothetical protein